MYLAYSMRRLDTRRQLLLENLFTLFLDDDYMRIRHGRSYHAWKEIPSSEERKKKFELDYFNKDFKAQNGHQDFFPPVALTTVLSGAGWYFVLSHVYPAAGSPGLTQLVPETLAWGFVGAFFASVLAIIEEFHTYSLTPGVYYTGPGGQQGPAKAGQSRHHNGSGSGYRRPAAVVFPYDVTDPDGSGLDRQGDPLPLHRRQSERTADARNKWNDRAGGAS